MMDPVLVREWDNDKFHQRVLELESKGYVARRETHTVTAEIHPDTGYVIHLYSIEMYPAVTDDERKSPETSDS